ncbi:MAG: CHAD domain-containing protein [Halomonas sp.]|uniref:CHAD domain-containing protein n=1 Tax=Halomonas sp. TaxID=1486246 RepID=UPI0019F113C3|nr:CHAD domain-containing protein [Halomonas sp.]MBE0489680.1 CHAD domain-containing protein [Halomonas sp.]
MRHLFLMRHAKAKQGSGDMADHDRPLRKRGRREAAAMALPLQQWQALEGEVHVSGAMRTRETLDEIAAQLPELSLIERAFVDEALYTFDGQVLLAWLKALPDETERVLVIGHNPALLELAHWLCIEAPTSLPPGGALHLTLPVTTPWLGLPQHGARLVASLIPEEASHALFQRQEPEPPDLGKADVGHRILELLSHQYRMVRALEPGVIAGVDPEFLHQFRVNLRRSRAIGESVLATACKSATKGKTPDKKAPASDEIPGLKKRLKRLKQRAQATSDLRDLDVFLESLDRTPPPLSPRTLRSLQRWLHARNREQHERLCQQLGDPGYAEEMLAWQRFLDAEEFRQALGQLSSKRIEKVLAERIARHDRDLTTLSRKSGDEAFHDLRKSVKRIRYLAEMQPKRHRDFLAGLKRRQTLLGDFQDLCTRQVWIGAFAHRAGITRERQQECAAWRAALEKEKRALRRKVMALAPLA